MTTFGTTSWLFYGKHLILLYTHRVREPLAIFIFILVLTVGLFEGTTWAGKAFSNSFLLKFQINSSSFTSLAAEEIRGTIWIDVLQLAEVMGGSKAVQKKGITIIEFSSHTLAIDPKDSHFSIKAKGQKKWRNTDFPHPIFKSGAHLMVPLDSIPELFKKSFLFHRQTQMLKEESDGLTPSPSGFQEVAVRYIFQDQKVWVSLEDLAGFLTVVIYSSQALRYNLVLPDFSILELAIEDRQVLKRKQPFLRLEDPPLLFSGSPYVTIGSINPLFGIDGRWEGKTKKLMLPVQYGRMREITPPNIHRLTYSGYQPQPFDLDIEEVSVYYQEPQPTYSAQHLDIYESVRDFLTNEPIDPQGNGWDRTSGELLTKLKGNFFKSPLEGGGRFEKVGGTARAANATLKVGFPMFQIQGGREYITLNGLNNQFNLVDQVVVSHSNNHYGDRNIGPLFKARVGYGENEFEVFQSTSQFSQTVQFRQQFEMLGFDLTAFSSHKNQQLTAKLEHYFFKNEVQGVSTLYHDLDFLQDIFGDGVVFTVDPSDEAALIAQVLSNRHMTSFLTLNYRSNNIIEINGVLGASVFKDDLVKNKRFIDEDYLLRVILGRKRSRLDLSYENSGPRYRSMGDPLRYRDREIVRLAPYLDFGRYWKIFGEYRKEETGVLVYQGIPPYTNTYLSGINLFNLKKNVIRTSYNKFESGLFGSRRIGGLDYTYYFGRDSLDFGASRSLLRDSFDRRSQESDTGRVSLQFLRPWWRVSLGEELTQNFYNQFNITRHQSLSSFLFQVNEMKFHLQYERAPLNFLRKENLHTGTLRIGRQVGKTKVFNLFYAASSLKTNLSDPEVWRAGLEYVTDFF